MPTRTLQPTAIRAEWSDYNPRTVMFSFEGGGEIAQTEVVSRIRLPVPPDELPLLNVRFGARAAELLGELSGLEDLAEVLVGDKYFTVIGSARPVRSDPSVKRAFVDPIADIMREIYDLPANIPVVYRKFQRSRGR